MSKRSKRWTSGPPTAAQVPSDGWEFFDFGWITQGDRLALLEAVKSADASPSNLPRLYPFFVKMIARWPWPSDPKDLSAYQKMPEGDVRGIAVQTLSAFREYSERVSTQKAARLERQSAGWKFEFEGLISDMIRTILSAKDELDAPKLYPLFAKIIKRWPYQGDPQDISQYNLMPMADFQAASVYTLKRLKDFVTRRNRD